MPAAGRNFGGFTLIEKLGVGGMGEVWRARDPQLERDVALKFLLDVALQDTEGKARLKREAKLLAALDHPNVAIIHGVVEQESSLCLVLELVSGEPLAARLQRGPLSVQELIPVARQIAAALGAAHAAGIVHRDLKPSNVMLRPDGSVKVLDFGIAKTQRGKSGSSAPTVDLDSTAAGALVGTPAYMSPEQARSGPLDARSDLWGLGVLIFEALTTVSPFRRDSIGETIGAILHAEPDWSLLPTDTAPELAALLRGLLEKAPDERVGSATEIAARLSTLTSADSRRTAPRRLVQFSFPAGVDGFPAISPDRACIAYAGDAAGVRKIFIKRLATDPPRPLTQGEFDEIAPTWSADGAAIAFMRATTPQRKLDPRDLYGGYYEPCEIVEVELRTGGQRRLVENGYNPCFSPDGSRLAFDASWAGPRRIWIADRNGRNPQQLTTDSSEAVEHLRPRFSADGTKLVFQGFERTRASVVVIDLATRRMTRVMDGQFSDIAPEFDSVGRGVYFSSFRSGGLNLWRIPLTIDDRAAGFAEQITTGAGQDLDVSVSRDGRRLAFSLLRQNADLWRLPVDPTSGKKAGRPERWIASSREESRGAWSPDGTRIAFNSDRTGEMNLWIREPDGELRQVTEGPGGDYQAQWSPDGGELVFFSNRGGPCSIWTVDLKTRKLERLSRHEGVELNPIYAPDGRSIAFHSDRDGRLELWLMDRDGSRPRQLTRCGVIGHFSRFSLDGRSILFRTQSGGESRSMWVSIEGGDPVATAPVIGGNHMSLSPDGKRVLDVLGHKTLWVSPLDGGDPEPIFEFDDPEARIDYPVWSPDGRYLLFDRYQPHGGEVWLLELGFGAQD